MSKPSVRKSVSKLRIIPAACVATGIALFATSPNLIPAGCPPPPCDGYIEVSANPPIQWPSQPEEPIQVEACCGGWRDASGDPIAKFNYGAIADLLGLVADPVDQDTVTYWTYELSDDPEAPPCTYVLTSSSGQRNDPVEYEWTSFSYWGIDIQTPGHYDIVLDVRNIDPPETKTWRSHSSCEYEEYYVTEPDGPLGGGATFVAIVHVKEDENAGCTSINIPPSSAGNYDVTFSGNMRETGYVSHVYGADLRHSDSQCGAQVSVTTSTTISAGVTAGLEVGVHGVISATISGSINTSNTIEASRACPPGEEPQLSPCRINILEVYQGTATTVLINRMRGEIGGPLEHEFDTTENVYLQQAHTRCCWTRHSGTEFDPPA